MNKRICAFLNLYLKETGYSKHFHTTFFPQVDKLKSKNQLLTIIRNLTNGFIAGNPMPGTEKSRSKPENKVQKGYSKFSDVFLVSALNGDGVQDIKVVLET